MYQTTNTRCLIKACQSLSIPYETLDTNGNFVALTVSGKKNLFFANYSTPFNSNSFCKIAKDKEFTRFLLKDVIQMPKTLGIFDPTYDEGGEIKNIGSLENDIEQIMTGLEFPVVLKPNSLSGGRNYSLCRSKEEIKNTLQNIFKKDNHYDYLALAQEYIEPQNEYRVIVFKNEVVLIYTREEEIKDKAVWRAIEDFIKPIFAKIDIGFAGLDIINGKNGMYLLEMNSEPGFAYFIEKNGEKPIIGLYENMLKHLISNA